MPQPVFGCKMVHTWQFVTVARRAWWQNCYLHPNSRVNNALVYKSKRSHVCSRCQSSLAFSRSSFKSAPPFHPSQTAWLSFVPTLWLAWSRTNWLNKTKSKALWGPVVWLKGAHGTYIFMRSSEIAVEYGRLRRCTCSTQTVARAHCRTTHRTQHIRKRSCNMLW
jgi:hypothetical protein